MKIFRSRIARGLAFALFFGLLFCSFWFYSYANANVGMSEIFTYTDFRNTESYGVRLTDASDEIVALVRDVYSGKKITEIDFQGGSVEGAFHYYFYAGNTYVTDLPELRDLDFSHAKSVALYSYEQCYFMDTSRTQQEHFSVDGGYDWMTYDLTKTVSVSAFSCDAGAILIPAEEWIGEQYSLWGTAKTRALLFIFFLGGAILPAVFLILCASWESRVSKPSRYWFFSEIIAVFGVSALLFLLRLFRISSFDWLRRFLALFGYGKLEYTYVSIAACMALMGTLFLYSVYALVLRIRESSLLQKSFVRWFCFKPFDALRRRVDKNYFQRYRYSTVFLARTVLFALVGGIFLTLFIITTVNRFWIVVRLLFLLAALFVGFLYFYGNFRDLRSLNRLLEHITELQDGNLSFRAEIPKDDPFSGYETQLRSVGEGFDQTLRSQISAERSRVDLITNVSHDLRTPLTSIIGYLDLLSKTELSDEAKDYVKVLVEKSNRLSHLVSDVFALSKANSGAEDVPMDDLDLFMLARQLVADLSDSAAASGKRVLLQGEGAAMICSNGNKIYRILQNMLDNALKYSLSGTRIFVILSSSGTEASVTVKNTASYEMNFTAQEITEQFVRGDPSRTGEGSGLGLAIAKRFSEQLGAEFSIEIDGDQFASKVSFPLKKNIESSDAEETKEDI